MFVIVSWNFLSARQGVPESTGVNSCGVDASFHSPFSFHFAERDVIHHRFPRCNTIPARMGSILAIGDFEELITIVDSVCVVMSAMTIDNFLFPFSGV